MDLRYCGQCGEAYLLSNGTCARCEQAPPSIPNAGMKTAFLRGLLSIGIPSQGGAEPQTDQSTEKNPKSLAVLLPSV